MFPADEILIARGKLSTLRKERKDQLERVQKICTTIVSEAHSALRDCEQKPPATGIHIEILENCIKNMKDAREKLITISLGMNELEDEAWPK